MQLVVPVKHLIMQRKMPLEVFRKYTGVYKYCFTANVPLSSKKIFSSLILLEKYRLAFEALCTKYSLGNTVRF